MGYGSATIEELCYATNRTLDRPLGRLLNRLLYASRLAAHALPANIRPVHIAPAHGALVDAMEVETTHRLGNKLSAGCGIINFWVWNYHLPLNSLVPRPLGRVVM